MTIVVPGHGTHDMLACGPEVLSTQHHVNLGELNWTFMLFFDSLPRELHQFRQASEEVIDSTPNHPNWPLNNEFPQLSVLLFLMYLLAEKCQHQRWKL